MRLSQQRPLHPSLPHILARPSALGVKSWRPSLAPPPPQRISPVARSGEPISVGRGTIVGARVSPTRRRGVCPGHLLSLRPTPRAPELQTQSPPGGCPGAGAARSATWETEAALPGLARSPDSRRGPPPPSPSRAASASFLCLHPHPFP